MKWTYTETMACWVTWTREIEADTEAEARQFVDDGSHSSGGFGP